MILYNLGFATIWNEFVPVERPVLLYLLASGEGHPVFAPKQNNAFSTQLLVFE